MFVSDNFPTSSYEYPVGSPRYNEYIAALDKVICKFHKQFTLQWVYFDDNNK